MNMGIIAWFGVIIVIGLLLANAQGAKTVGTTFFSGLDTTLRDLERLPQKKL